VRPQAVALVEVVEVVELRRPAAQAAADEPERGACRRVAEAVLVRWFPKRTMKDPWERLLRSRLG
jgi:hypothetical protein